MHGALLARCDEMRRDAPTTALVSTDSMALHHRHSEAITGTQRHSEAPRGLP